MICSNAISNTSTKSQPLQTYRRKSLQIEAPHFKSLISLKTNRRLSLYQSKRTSEKKLPPANRVKSAISLSRWGNHAKIKRSSTPQTRVCVACHSIFRSLLVARMNRRAERYLHRALYAAAPPAHVIESCTGCRRTCDEDEELCDLRRD